ncbi:sulfite exporter TauE/SafE family protein [Caenimonas terrae]|uniref:Probable membrane transporter protein n=1 Tax=Caenimonas terrae TaxID=696074 RepID=A0ABW0NEL4_9BURK
MFLEPRLIAELLLLGLATGFLAGLLGIGGGMLMVPAVTFVLAAKGFPPEHIVKMAVATSLATICFTSISSVRAHHKRGAVLWPVVLRLTPGILLGAALGAQVAVAMPTRALSILFSVFITFAATQMLLNRKPEPTRTLPGTPGMVAVGGGIGVLSALVGAGGAFVSVPFMQWCNVRIHNAVATSAALGFPVALAGTASYVWAGRNLQNLPGSLGYLYLPGLVLISLASMTMAPLGARTAHGMDIRPLKRVFALVLYCLAAYFLFR